MKGVRIRRVGGTVLAATVVATVVAAALVAATVATMALTGPTSPLGASRGGTPPNLIVALGGYSQFWTASGRGDLHGTVDDAAVLRRDDELAVWINQNATSAEQFQALRDAQYDGGDGGAYDQSLTISTGLGSVLGPAYVKGRLSGALPLTSALINGSSGSSGDFVSTGTPKQFFSHPRPYLPSDPGAFAVAGDVRGCSPAVANASSQQSIRIGMPYADARGNLAITRIPATLDTTHQFSRNDVLLDAQYGTTGICGGGSFPSGHTTTAYEAGITLATLLPELAPEILARASEAGNSRIVLGVHYPLDVVGGRIAGEAALAARWSDAAYRTAVLEPARAELLAYLRSSLRSATGHGLAWNIAHQRPYTSNPYDGRRMPGGTAQIVTDRASALAAYAERMSYGFPASGTTGLAASVPAGAANLLRTSFPTLSDAQRSAVLAQTELASGFPLDGTGTAAGAWQRLDLAAAMSAAVQVTAADGVKVVATGGLARVLPG